MKITYDEEVDAMYILLIEGNHQCRTVSLNDEVALDFDVRERLVGIEILDAKRVMGKGKLPRVVIDSLTLSMTGSPKKLPPSRVAVKSASRLRKAS